MNKFFQKLLGKSQADLKNLMQEDEETILVSLKKEYEGTGIKVSYLPQMLVERKYAAAKAVIFLHRGEDKIIAIEVGKNSLFDVVFLDKKNKKIFTKKFENNSKLETFSKNMRMNFLKFFNGIKLDTEKSFTEFSEVSNNYLYKRTLEEFVLRKEIPEYHVAS